MTAIADTCVVVWLLEGPAERLSQAALLALAGEQIGVPAAVVLEVAYLTQCGRLPARVYDEVVAELSSSDGVLSVVSLGLDAFRAASEIPRAESTDPFDRMIAGTAMAAGLPLITADTKLPAVTGLDVIW